MYNGILETVSALVTMDNQRRVSCKRKVLLEYLSASPSRFSTNIFL